MTEHTPEPCECRVTVNAERVMGAGGDFIVAYCPTHAAAPDLLAALKEFIVAYCPTHAAAPDLLAALKETDKALGVIYGETENGLPPSPRPRGTPMPEHTPGPWAADFELLHRSLEDGIYRAGQHEFLRKVEAVNADLLAALEAYIEPDCDCYQRAQGRHSIVCNNARAAIAKAKGGQGGR